MSNLSMTTTDGYASAADAAPSTNEDLELSVQDKGAAETPIAAPGVASGLSKPRAGLIADQPRGAGAGAGIGVAATARLSSLDTLESEAIHIIREVVAEFEKPALLFSGGKDSVVMLHLATKAFWPGKVPFPVLHVDTGHNFPEVIDFRDRTVERLGLKLVVGSVQEFIDSGELAERADGTRNPLQTVPLLDAIQRNKFDAVFGGGRRDEDKARAKERILSLRDEFGQWDPRNQRPELWNLYNGRHTVGQHVRAFPISNWTELDVWRYIERENIELPGLYYAHRPRSLCPRRHVARRRRGLPAARTRGSHHQDRPLPDRRRHVLHRRRGIGRRHRARRRHRGCRLHHHRTWRHPGR